jgi:hypothetical protein
MRIRPATTRLYTVLDVADAKSLRSAPAAWDRLRESEGPFQLPGPAEWEEASQQPPFPARAEAIARVMRSAGAKNIASYGVGTAMLERALTRAAPNIPLTCTDTAPAPSNDSGPCSRPRLWSVTTSAVDRFTTRTFTSTTASTRS